MINEYLKIVPKYQTKPGTDMKATMKSQIHNGDKFGRLRVLYRIDDKFERNGKRRVAYHCVCACGRHVDVRGIDLHSGSTVSCGCRSHEFNKDKTIDLTGRQIGFWTVLGRADDVIEAGGRRRVAWKVRCKCGTERVLRANQLLSGRSLSCGCWRSLQRHMNGQLYNLEGRKFGMLRVISRADDVIDEHGWHTPAYICKCTCGTFCTRSARQLVYYGVKSCGCLNTSSGEAKIVKLLEENKVTFKREYTPDGLRDVKPLRFDFVIFDNNGSLRYVIEFDGKQHYEYDDNSYFDKQHVDTIQDHDRIKNQYCFSHNIPLIRIPYTHLNDLVYEDLVPETTRYLLMNPAA